MSQGNSPAFPCKDGKNQIWSGMNLRDYFALEAMNGLIKVLDSNKHSPEDIAKKSYILANEMLDQREKYK